MNLLSALLRFKEQLQVTAPALANKLKHGMQRHTLQQSMASLAARAERGFPFPEDHYALFEVFNGQRSSKACMLPPVGGAPTGLSLGSLDMVHAWRDNAQGMIYLLKNLSGYGSVTNDTRINREFWNPHWFPFASGEAMQDGEGVGMMLFLDFAPAAEGRRGQIVLEVTPSIRFKLHLRRSVVAASLGSLFQALVADMASGAIIYDSSRGLCKNESAGVGHVETNTETEIKSSPQRHSATKLPDLLTRWHRVIAETQRTISWYQVSPPVPRAELDALVHAIGRPLPQLLQHLLELGASWQWRDTEYDVIFSQPAEILQDFFAPDEDVPAIEVAISLSPKVKPYFYSGNRIPFAYSDYLRFQIDEDPAPGGTHGQIVVTDHDEQTINWVAESLEAFVLHGLDQLQRVIDTGRYPDE